MGIPKQTFGIIDANVMMAPYPGFSFMNATGSQGEITVAILGSTLSWFADDSASYQNNELGEQYYYACFG